MSIITKIKAINLKDRTFEHELGPISIIAGPNQSGKTAVLNAIELGLLGYSPSLDKNNPGIFELSSGVRMEVGISLDGGPLTTRAWHKDGDSVKYTGSKDPLIPAIMIDLDSYFAMSAKQKIAYIFSKLENQPLTVADLIERIKAIDPENTTMEAAAQREAAIAVLKEQKDGTIQEVLELAIATFADKLKTAKKDVERMKGTIQGISELKANEESYSGPSESEIYAKEAGLDNEIAVLNSRKGALQAKQLESDQNALKRARLTAEIAAMGDTSTAPDPLAITEDLATLRGALRSTEIHATEQAREMNAVKAEDEENSRISAELDRLTALQPTAEILTEIDVLESIVLAYNPQVEVAALDGGFQARIDLSRKRDSIQELLDEQVRDDSDRAELLSHAECPTCKAKAKGWQAAYEAEYEAEKAKRTAAIEQARFDLGECEDALEKANFDLTAINAVKADAAAAKESLNALKVKTASYDAARVKELLGKVRPPRPAQIWAPYDLQMADLKTKITAKESELAAAAKFAALPELKRQLAELPTATSVEGDLGAVIMAISAKNAEKGELTSAKQAIANRKADKKRIAEADQAYANALLELEMNKAAGKAMVDAQAELMGAAFGPLLAVANRFCAGLIKSPLEYHDVEIGRFQNKKWVTTRTMSGQEKIVVFAALSAALGASSTARIIIVDELGRMTKENKARFIANAFSMISENVVSQLIAVDVTPEDWANDKSITLIETK